MRPTTIGWTMAGNTTMALWRMELTPLATTLFHSHNTAPHMYVCGTFGGVQEGKVYPLP
jgi:hypothetical protein